MCACVHPKNDNSFGASNMMAGNRKLPLSYSPLRAISLVPYFLQKMFSMTKIGRFLCGFSVADFSAVGFLDPFKT